ncbi:MAG: 4Fe-4S binding protein [Candidatus Lokiarchaeota archaeon]|nr:4Fe-4S binding protein [Candidatus Lokiarchaeota archaeon]
MANESISEDSGIYRKLQQHLDEMPVGFPPVKSGADIRLLKHLFTPEEAKIAMFLKFGWDRDLEPLETIYKCAKETGISLEELETILDRMVSKGSIMSKKDGGKKYYGNALLMIGMFEFQVNRLTKDFVKDYEDYFIQGWLPESFRVKAAQMRTIPVEKSIEFEHNVSTYDNITKVIDEAEGPFAILNCVCRQVKDILEDPCKATDRREVCMASGIMAQLTIDQGRGRAITKEEALEILQKNQEEGLVIQPDNSQILSFVCSCCSCCCENLSKYILLPNPANVVIANYYAEVDSDLCTGCGTCVEICPMKAIKLKDDISSIIRKRCIGCGNCAAKCPSEAISMNKRERQFTPFPSMDVLFDKVMQRKIRLKEQSIKK